MDFFNYIILKYIRRFFNFKKIIVIILIFLVLCFSFNVSFASEGDTLTPSDATYFDAYANLNNIYDNIYANIILRLETTNEARRKEICGYFLNSLYFPYICFQSNAEPVRFPIDVTPVARQNMYIFFNCIYQNGSTTYTQTNEQVFWFGLANYTVSKRSYRAGTDSFYYSSFNNASFSAKTDFTDEVYLYDWYSKPLVLFDYPDFFSEYLLNVRSGVSNKNILSEISAMGDTLENIDNEIAEMNEFFQNQETDPITNNDLPSDSMNNITESGFNGVFDMFYNAFTNENPNAYKTFTIPFLNYSFTLYSKSFSQTIIRAGFKPLVDFISAFYYFLVSRFIVKDISKYIDDLKNGDISKTETNIKADML